MVNLKGIFPPLPTSFDLNEDLALDKMRENIKKLCQFKLSGFLVLGSNGELVNLSENEKVEIYEMAREAIPPEQLLLTGSGGQSTRETIKLTKLAAKSGADAVLVLNPYYYKGLMTAEALSNHYFDVAEASPVPVIIYNMPANSGLDMNADTIIKISAHQNIIGMKDSGGNLGKMGDIRNCVKQDFQILAGSAGFLLPALSVGAIGGILALANIAPEHCLTVFKNFIDGDFESAKQMQIKMINLNSAITSKWGIPALKAAMDHLGLYGGLARKPIIPIKQEIKDQLFNILNNNEVLLFQKNT